MTNLDELIQHALGTVQAAGRIPKPSFTPRMGALEMARMIDHTLLKPEATADQVRRLCEEGLHYQFASICVNPTWVPLCVELLAGSEVKPCAVAGFSLGATLPAVKAFEAQQVVELGAKEVDMVMNVGKLKDGDYRLVYEDIAGVADACHEGGALLKVIIETGLLTDDEKVVACVICKQAGADFVKTATGFNGGGATAPDIALMRFVVGPTMGVKAAGGVRSVNDALAMVAAGATRIGTSAGVKIIDQLSGAGDVASEASSAAQGGLKVVGDQY